MYNPAEERTVIGISNLLRMETDIACRKQLSVNGIKADQITSDEKSYMKTRQTLLIIV